MGEVPLWDPSARVTSTALEVHHEGMEDFGSVGNGKPGGKEVPTSSWEWMSCVQVWLSATELKTVEVKLLSSSKFLTKALLRKQPLYIAQNIGKSTESPSKGKALITQ